MKKFLLLIFVLSFTTVSSFAYGGGYGLDYWWYIRDAIWMYLLIWVLIPMVITGLMASFRSVAVAPWLFACLFLGWFTPILLGITIQTPEKIARKQFEIELEYKKLKENSWEARSEKIEEELSKAE